MTNEDSIYLKKTVKGAGIIFLGVFFGYALGYITRIIIARYLGVESYGLISLGLAVLSIFAIFSLLGFSASVPRFISYYKTEREIRGVILTSIKISLPLSVFFSTVMFFFSSQIAMFFNEPSLTAIIQIFALSLPFYVVLGILVSCFQGFQLPIYKFYTQDLIYEIAKIILVIVFIFFGLGIIGATIGWAISFIIFALIAAVILQKKVFPTFKSKIKPIYNTKELLVFSLPLFFMGFSLFVIGWTDIIMLGFFNTIEVVGIYNVALPTSMIISIILGAFSYLFMPIVSDLYSRGEIKQFKNLYKSVTRWVFLVSFPLFLVFFIYPHIIISILFGAEFIEASNILRILSIGYFASAFLGVYSPSFTAFGRTKLNLLISLIIASTNFILNLILIPKHGMFGASVAMTSSLIIGSVVGVSIMYFLMKTQPISLSLLKSGLAGLLSAILFLYIPGFFFTIHFWYIPIGGFLFLFFYFIFSLALKTFTFDDIIILKSLESKTGIRIKWLREFIKKFI